MRDNGGAGMIKKGFWIFLGLLFFSTALGAENPGRVKSIYDFDSRLFLFEPQGFDPFQYRPFDPSSYAFVKGSGQTDAIGGIYFDSYRNQYLVFSESFLQLNTNLFVSGNLQAQTLMDLKDYPIGVVKGDFIIEFFTRHYPFLKLKVFQNFEELIFYALRGEILVFAQNFPTAMLYLSKYRALNHFRQFRIFFPETREAGNSDLRTLLEESSSKPEKEKPLKPEESQKEPEIKKSSEPSKPKEPEKKNEVPAEKALKPEETAPQNRPFWFWASWLAGGAVFVAAAFWLLRKKSGRSMGVQELLSGGENRQTEFKSSLRFDYQSGQINPALEYAAMRSVCAFLNSEGGNLLIGVNDEGQVVGLEPDYRVLNKKNKDGWILKFSELVNDYLGKENHQYLKVSVMVQFGLEFARIEVKPSKKPVFLKHKNREEFFIRTGAASQAMGIKETHEYIVSRWG